jgi:N-acetylneuraminic acid mutarotase
MPTATYAHAVGVANNVLYAVGGKSSTGAGLATLQAYTPATNSWATKAPLPEARWDLNGTGTINGVLYVAGGIGSAGPSRTLYAYTPSTNTWAVKTPMPIAGACGASGVIAGQLYVYTGCIGGTAAFQRYDLATKSWEVLTLPSVSSRPYPVAAAIGGKFYLVGGYQFPYGTLTVEAYDPTTRSWSPRASMYTQRFSASAAVINGLLYVASGAGPSGPSKSVEVYDPGSNIWRSRPYMPTGRTASGAAGLNGKLYTVGGFNNGAVATNEVYTPGDVWVTKTPMPTARSGHVAGVVNGKLYAVGGTAGSIRLATNQAFTPATNKMGQQRPPPRAAQLCQWRGRNQRRAVCVRRYHQYQVQ